MGRATRLAAAVLIVASDSSLEIGSTRLHLTFALDRPGAMLLGVAALLWIASGAYASQYLQGRPNAGQFAVCWLMTRMSAKKRFNICSATSGIRGQSTKPAPTLCPS